MALQSPFFLFCGFAKKEDINEKFPKIITLGGNYENTKKFLVHCSHVICKQPVRSEIFLGACLTGKWILIPKYIQDCYEQQCWLKEDAYEWESKFITDCSSSYEKNLYNAPKCHRICIQQKGCEIFKGWKVVLLIDDKAKSSKYTKLLKLGKAEIINTFASSAPEITTGITHVFFESLQFEQLFLFQNRSKILRPEYIDSCIIEVTLSATQLFEIPPVPSLLSTKDIEYSYSGTMGRTVDVNNSVDYQNNHTNNNTTFVAADSFNIDRKRSNSIHCEQKINLDMEELQLCHSPFNSNNSTLPFSVPCTSSLSSVLMEHNKKFEVDLNTIAETNTEDNCISENNLISDISYKSSIVESNFKEIDINTYQLHENNIAQEKNNERNNLVDEFLEEPEMKEISSAAALNFGNVHIAKRSESEDNVTFSKKHLNMKNSKGVDDDRFYETLKLLNEKARSTKISFGCSKGQNKITSYFLDSNKECYAKRKLISEQFSNCDNFISSIPSSSFKIPKLEKDINMLCNKNNSYMDTSSQIDIMDDEHNKNCSALINNKIENVKWEPDNHHRHPNVTEQLKSKTNDNSKEDCAFAISGNLMSLIDVCLEENDPCVALDVAESLICSSYHPHPHMLNSLMFRVLECSLNERISNRTIIILRRIFHLHRPGNNQLGQCYLDALSLCGKEKVSPWFVLSEIICKCIQLKVSHNRNTQNAEHLLSFVTDVIDYNFKDFKFRNKFPRKLFLERKDLLPIAAKIFWPADSEYFGSVNRQCKELFQHMYQLLMCNIRPDHLFKTLLPLQKLVGIVSECSVFFYPGTQRNVYNTSQIQNVATSLLSAIQDPLRNKNSLLHLFLDTMQCTWLRMLFCQKFLDQNAASLNSVLVGDNNLTLETIVNDYMQRTPSSYKYRLRNHSSSAVPKAKQCCDKVRMKYEDSKQHKSDESYIGINKRNAKGETKLHIACKNGKDEDVKKLLEVSGIDLNIQDNAGWTPLHEACNKGHFECAKLLLEWCPPDRDNGKRVKLMVQAENGITPLHDAVMSNSITIADLLLKQGGRKLLERCTKNGLTPCDMAVSSEMDQLLLSALDCSYKVLEGDLQNEVIEISSESDDEEEHSSDLNVCQYLILVYHMLVSYLAVYRIDEMLEQLKQILEEEKEITPFEKQSYFNPTTNSCNMQVLSKAVSTVLSNYKSSYTTLPELDARKKDLYFALKIPDEIEKVLQSVDVLNQESNASTISMALEYLGVKYRL